MRKRWQLTGISSIMMMLFALPEGHDVSSGDGQRASKQQLLEEYSLKNPIADF